MVHINFQIACQSVLKETTISVFSIINHWNEKRTIKQKKTKTAKNQNKTKQTKQNKQNKTKQTKKTEQKANKKEKQRLMFGEFKSQFGSS